VRAAGGERIFKFADLMAFNNSRDKDQKAAARIDAQKVAKLAEMLKRGQITRAQELEGVRAIKAAAKAAREARREKD
jgi:hypothetical protein